jgi:hypothetical protein
MNHRGTETRRREEGRGEEERRRKELEKRQGTLIVTNPH